MSANTNRAALLFIAIFAIALVPRIIPRDHITIDEAAHWVGRSENFRQALIEGDWRSTSLAFHPGVMTMWSGMFGIIVDEIISGDDLRETDNLTYRINARRIISVVNAFLIALSFVFMIRLFPERIALLAALLAALSPYMIEHGSILHVDGLSTGFMYLSFLAGIIALGFDTGGYVYNVQSQTRWPWWIASAIFGGLTMITKVTTVSVFGILVFFMLVVNWRHLRWRLLPRQMGPFFAWGLIAIVTAVGLYPATWTAMDSVFDRFLTGVDNVYVGHYNYFLGEPTIHPGPLFYVVTTAYRITPIVMIGLLLAPFVLSRKQFRPYRERILSLVLFVVLFTALMMIQRKQQDRYVLPIFPALYVFAAFGLTFGADHLWHAFNKRRRTPLVLNRSLVWAIVLVPLIAFWIAYHPYLRAYYNPLLGGGPAAKALIRIGSGEGLDQAGKWIAQNHESNCDIDVISENMSSLQVHVPCANVISPRFWPQYIREADYVVLYIAFQQRQLYAYLDSVFEPLEPAHVVRINHIDYAYVYDLKQTPPEIDWDLLEESGINIEPAADS